MKRNDIIVLAAIAAAMVLRKRSGASPVGKVRRNIFAEIEQLQSYDIPLHGDWEQLNTAQRDDVTNVMLQTTYKQRQRAGMDRSELWALITPGYYKQICRQYLKLVNPAIGKIQYPHKTYQVRNSRGDVVLTYNDYDPERDMQLAIDWISDSRDPYVMTVAAIAKGNRWLWKGKKSGGQLLTRGLADELFFSKTNLEGERRLYRALIDNKNGWSVDKFVEQYLCDMPGAKDAALQALRQFPTPKGAKEYILDQYYQSLDDGTPDYDPQEDLPF